MNKPIPIIVIETIARGVAWAIVMWLIRDVASATQISAQIGEAVAAAAVAGMSLYHSLHDRIGIAVPPMRPASIGKLVSESSITLDIDKLRGDQTARVEKSDPRDQLGDHAPDAASPTVTRNN